MSLTEEEEFELLSLEREKAMASKQQSQEQDSQSMQSQNIFGKIFNVPGATSRAAIQANPALAVAGPLAGIAGLSGIGGQEARQAASHGMQQPDSVPTFQSMQQNNVLATALTGGVPIGMAMDIATNPADVLASLIGKAPGAKQLGSAISGGVKKIFRYDNALKQAEKAKTSLDSLRSNLGKAKEIALSNTGDIPVDVNFSGNVSSKVINAIKNPVYGVEFTPEGGVVGNIRNLDKIKIALNDIVTAKDFVEAGNMEKRQIMQFAGRLRDDMVNAANRAGKPELGKALKGYHDFMERYGKINDHLVDKYGDAMANKLKATFKWSSEPAIKKAWKDVSKSSPEIKSVMNSMNRRELLKDLLAISGATAAIGASVKVIKGD